MSWYARNTVAKTKGQKQWVPFSTQTNELLSGHIIDEALLTANLGATVIQDRHKYWVKAEPFKDRLEIGAYYWSRAAGAVMMTGKMTGRIYQINVRDFVDYARDGHVNGGELNGTFDFVKRGSTRYIVRTGA